MTIAEIRLWGRTIGAVSLEENDAYASFEYAPDFLEVIRAKKYKTLNV